MSAPLTFRPDPEVAARLKKRASAGMKITTLVNRALRAFFKIKKP